MEIGDEIEYEVEKVLGKKKIQGRDHYLIKWKGYSNEDNTWEPSENLLNAQDALKDFLNGNQGQQ